METTPNTREKDQVIDFIRLCFRHWYYFIISGTVCLIIALIYLKTATPVYQVEASVALRHDESLTGSVSRSSGGLLSAIGLSRGTENIEDETIKMSSHGNIKQVVKALDLNKVYTLVQCWGLSKKPLYDRSPVLLSTNPVLADTLGGIIEFKLHVDKAGRGELKVKYGNSYKSRFTIESFPATVSLPIADFTLSLSSEYAVYEKPFNINILYTNYDYIAQIYKNLITIDFHKKNSDLISLAIQSPNPDMSKKLIRTTIDQYNKNWDADKEYVYNSTITYMKQRLEENILALSNADREIQQFKDQHNLTNIEADVKFYYAQSAETQKELLSAATKINLMEIIREFIQDEANRYGLIPFTLAGEDQAVNTFIEKYNEAMVQRNDLRKNQPKSLLLGRLEEQLNLQRNNVIVTINKEMEGLQVVLDNIKRKDAEVTRKIGSVPLIEREYIHLRREQELQQNIYIFLLEKREELGIHSVSLMPKLKVIDEPYVNNKLVSPRLFRTLLTALFFGGVVIPWILIYGLPYVRTLRRKEE
jgi:uncharacterized protein involved in exopolysaccharide biosynthesis